jgi:hypothetical protein
MNATGSSEHATPNPHFRAADFHPLFQAVFALEKRRDLMNFRIGPIPYWGLIRLPLVIRLLDRISGELDSGDIFLKPPRVGAARTVSYVLASLRRLPSRHVDKDFVFFCSGVNWVHRGAAFFNTRVDYFAERLPGDRTLLIEGAEALRYRVPRAIGSVACKGGLTLPGALWARIGRLGRKHSGQLAEFIAVVTEAIGDALTAADYALLADYLRRALLRSRVYYAVCERLLDRLRPRLLFVESAHFGVDIELVVAARARGIKTAEYQHGAVNPVCPYHNFEPALLAAGYDRCLPDYFLSYGDFWNRHVTTSAQVVSIGNPHVAAALARPRAARMATGSVYYLSSAGPARSCIERIRDLVAEGFAVTFRPHPVERPSLRARYGTAFDDLGIEVDESDDFYARLRDHSVVVGDGRSTSIFEALALAGPNVFVLETSRRMSEEMPTHDCLRTVTSARDLRSRLAEAPRHSVDIDELFAPTWQERFSRFVAAAFGD